MTRVLPPAASVVYFCTEPTPTETGLASTWLLVSAKSRIIRAGLSVANTLTFGSSPPVDRVMMTSPLALLL